MLSLSHMTRSQGSTGHHCHTEEKICFTVAVQCQENEPNILTHGGMDFVSLAAVVGDH